MAFGVTPEGFKAKRFEDILAEISANLKTELNIDIDANPDSISKVLTNIYTLALAEEWALPQALQSMFDIDKAEGKHLDNLVGIQKLTRLPAVASFGDEYVTASQETTVPTGSTFSDASGNTYSNPAEIPVSLTACVDAVLQVNPAAMVGDTITIVINSVISSEQIVTTVQDALDALIIKINSFTTMNATDLSSGGDFIVRIENEDDTVASNVTINNFIINALTSFGVIERDETSAFGVSPDTVIVPPSVTGIISVTNRYTFVAGRAEETDIELRARYKLSFSAGGSCTIDAILADLLQVSGVVTALVTENTSIYPDTDGNPPKSFLCVVKGGQDEDIAASIWSNKPSGIETSGDQVAIAVDSLGNDQPVRFSRPTPIYVHVNVAYSLYDEQSNLFPLDGENQILNTILEYGNGLSIGEDVIPQRFSSEVFQNVQGLSIVNVTVGTTPNSTDPTPILTPNIISIDGTSEASFEIGRITVSEI